jgi:hypothetical protein
MLLASSPTWRREALEHSSTAPLGFIPLYAQVLTTAVYTERTARTGLANSVIVGRARSSLRLIAGRRNIYT